MILNWLLRTNQSSSLEVEVAKLRLENELLAELNENLRRWLLANTAAAAAMAKMLGASDGQSDAPVVPGRQAAANGRILHP